jgi:hypothetical protein
MRCYINKPALPLYDIRDENFSEYHNDDYSGPQGLASSIRAGGGNGIVYNSVRDPQGECVAAFKPKAVTIPIQGSHYKYIWNGKSKKIEHILKISLVDSMDNKLKVTNIKRS